MFLHLGNNYLVNTKDVIGIFDIENTSVSANTKEFLNFAAKNRRVVNCLKALWCALIKTLRKLCI